MSFNTIKVLLSLLAITLTAGCLTTADTVVYETTVRTGTVVTVTPPRPIYGVPERGDVVLACSTVQAVYDHLNGYATRGCQLMTVNYAKPRSWYQAENGRCYQISQFSSGSWPYYAAEPGVCRGNYRGTDKSEERRRYYERNRPQYYDYPPHRPYNTGITYTVRIRS